jgi:hypothetical protein
VEKMAVESTERGKGNELGTLPMLDSSPPAGVMYPGYHGLSVMTQKSGYDQLPPVANGWGTMYSMPDMAPLLLVEEEEPPT